MRVDGTYLEESRVGSRALDVSVNLSDSHCGGGVALKRVEW